MWTFFAQPYDISARGFYFETVEEYRAGRAQAVNDFGQPVEEFEIQFIDGEDIDAVLFEALKPHQGNIASFMEHAKDWTEYDKQTLIIAVGECGYAFDPGTDNPDDLDIDLYELDSLRDLAIQFVDDGLFGDIPDHLAGYIDHDAIARDLACDYSETTIAGTRLVYRCG